MSFLTVFTIFHTAISIAAMIVGLFFLAGLLSGRQKNWATAWSLGLLAATTITGFLFPFHGVTPAIGTGIVSTLLLALAYLARYRFGLVGGWRASFAVSAITALYLDWFVFVVQIFAKIPALHTLAPTGSEAPFGAAQGIVLLAFVVLGYLAVKRAPVATATSTA